MMASEPPPGCPLTMREYYCVVRLARGESRAAIGAALGVTKSVVDTHLANANRRAGTHTAAQLVAHCFLKGWISSGVALSRAQDELAAVVLQLAAERDERDADDAMRRDQLTPGEALYLRSFEQWLRDCTDQHALERGFMLRALYYERSMIAGSELVPPWEVLGAPLPRRRSRLKVFPIVIRPRGRFRTVAVD